MKASTTPHKRRLSRAALLPIIGLAVLAVAVLAPQLLQRSSGAFPEVAAAANLPADFDEMRGFFREVAQEKGGAYAFEVLRRAELPRGTDLHLLGHVVGDELYAQQGIEGIKTCTHDFRNACSHTIVIGALLEHGEGALPEIRNACYEAPGGSGAYTMCFHGLGHGVLSYLGYDLPKAVSFCEKLGTPAYNNREYVECVGGTIMELMSGVYDPQTWREQAPEYLRTDEPLYTCTAAFMPHEVRDICYQYLTPHLILSAGGNLGQPTEADFREAMELCRDAPSREEELVCIGAFGKEFVVLAQGRDIRDITAMSDEALRQVFDWCAIAGETAGIDACIESAVASLYWGGENDRSVALRFCEQVPEGEHSDTCAAELIGAVGYYVNDKPYRRAFCSELPDLYQGRCANELDL